MTKNWTKAETETMTEKASFHLPRSPPQLNLKVSQKSWRWQRSYNRELRQGGDIEQSHASVTQFHPTIQ